MAKEVVVTREGYNKLEQELENLRTVKRKEVADKIKVARGYGDLSENAEYDAAKEEQSHNESRINEIRQILSVATVVAAGSHANLKVSIGTTVTLVDAKGKTTEFTIVGTTETNSLEHKISNESPAGQALIGHGEGEEVEFVTPTGKAKKYTITAITR